MWNVMKPTWSRGEFPKTKIEIIKLKDVFVAGEGLIFNDSLEVIGPVIEYQTPDEHIERAYEELQKAIASDGLEQIEGPAILCVQPGWGNYGHWLIEMLPKASVAEQLFPNLNIKFIVPAVTGRMNQVIEDSLSLIGIDKQRLVKYALAPARVHQILLVRGLTVHGSYMSPLVFTPLNRIASQVDAGEANRLYIKRKHPAYRVFENEEQVCAILSRRGFAIVSPEEHSFRDQVSMFKGAKEIFGIASAALSSICFCRPGTNVTMFYPSSMADTFYWFIAEHRNLSFRDVRCELAGESKTHLPWDTNLQIGADELLSLIEVSSQ
jgi:capsular polysaccharide biosynthesis protein